MPNSVNASSGLDSVAFLGHVISAKGVSVDSQKIEAIVKWKPPTNVIEIRNFSRFGRVISEVC